MLQFLITYTRLPISRFFINSIENGPGNETPLNENWTEQSFNPADANCALGAVTDACVYYNDSKNDDSMCLSVSSYLDEVDI